MAFFVDANTGRLYVRRADSYAEEQKYEQALADYEGQQAASSLPARTLPLVAPTRCLGLV